jgi:hypothetical protein
VPDTPQQVHLVGLEFHSSPSSVPEPAAGELGLDVLGGDLDPGDHALQHGDQGWAM